MDATAKAVCVCVCVQRERDGIYKGMDMYRKCSRTRMCCDIMGRSWQLLVILSTLYSPWWNRRGSKLHSEISELFKQQVAITVFYPCRMKHFGTL